MSRSNPDIRRLHFVNAATAAFGMVAGWLMGMVLPAVDGGDPILSPRPAPTDRRNRMIGRTPPCVKQILGTLAVRGCR